MRRAMSDTEETLTEKADRLAREAVKREAAKHRPGPGPVSKLYCRMDAHLWPCSTIQVLSEAEEAITEAEEEESRIANGPYLCGYQTRAARMYEDPEPAEHCEAEVDNEGDCCPAHEEQDDYDPWGDD